MSNRMNEEALSTLASTLEDIKKLVVALRVAGTDEAAEAALNAIYEDPLSVEVLYGWRNAGSSPGNPEEYRIVLTTGGPHIEIRGKLNVHNLPATASLIFQGWFEPEIMYPESEEDEKILLEYASQFYYGE